MSKTRGFDLVLIYDFGQGNEDCRVTGDLIPGEAATGPTYDCGGTPGCGPELDDLRFYRDERKEGSKVAVWVEVEDDDNNIEKSMTDDIYEAMEKDWDDGPDPDEARDRRMSGDD